MNGHGYTHLVAVGACYIDTILTVPVYPSEDAKQRASSISRRRGGNCPNALGVIQQLFPSLPDQDATKDPSARNSPELILLSTLPGRTSSDTEFIAQSLNLPDTTGDNSLRASVNLDHTFYRSTVTTAASSYIILSQATKSRTIVNYNALDEMTLSEFQSAVGSLLTSPSKKRIWFHFEGRIPDVLLQCIQWLRSTFPRHHSSPETDVEVTISVECEKPLRPGLETLAEWADVVFYSRSWAEGQGYRTAEECLAHEAKRIALTRKENTGMERGPSKVMLCCTWGASGASALELDVDDGRVCDNIDATQVVSRHAWHPPPPDELRVVDTIGAGDTWIAGMLFCLLSRSHWTMERKVDFASELAGRKISRDGFDGLGEEMRLKIE